MTNDEVLQVVHLEKKFGDNLVLRDIDFTAHKGEVISILGQSGSGKSTLLRCMNLLETPTGGQILFHGEDIQQPSFHLSRYRALVSMVFQQFNLFANMTVLENCVRGQVKVLKKPRKEAAEIAMHYLDKVGMGPYIHARPAQISGGQKQRVAIARALSMQPEALLFDEPTSALDPEMVGEVLKVMRDLSETGLTMLVVTHEMAFARDVSSRVVFMADGVIEEDEKPGAFFTAPQSEKARAFLQRMLGENAG